MTENMSVTSSRQHHWLCQSKHHVYVLQILSITACPTITFRMHLLQILCITACPIITSHAPPTNPVHHCMSHNHISCISYKSCACSTITFRVHLLQILCIAACPIITSHASPTITSHVSPTNPVHRCMSYNHISHASPINPSI